MSLLLPTQIEPFFVLFPEGPLVIPWRSRTQGRGLKLGSLTHWWCRWAHLGQRPRTGPLVVRCWSFMPSRHGVLVFSLLLSALDPMASFCTRGFVRVFRSSATGGVPAMRRGACSFLRAASSNRRLRALSSSSKSYDPEQSRMFDQESIVQVTFNDAPVKPISKRESHLTRLGPVLHRAFSVFHFDSKGRLLLQRRASSKITFPMYWTNTCCSHPLWSPFEMGEDKQDPVLGCKRAALRKLGQELGVPADALTPEDLLYTTRIHYIADSDDEWGEHEVDYIFLSQWRGKDGELPLNINPNEVHEVKYVTQDELRSMIRAADVQRDRDRHAGEVVRLTPWSRAIMERFLFQWWKDLNQLERHANDSRIHRLGRVL